MVEHAAVGWFELDKKSISKCATYGISIDYAAAELVKSLNIPFWNICKKINFSATRVNQIGIPGRGKSEWMGEVPRNPHYYPYICGRISGHTQMPGKQHKCRV